MKIEILWFDDCPNYQRAAELLREVLREESVDTPIEMMKVENDASAVAQKFLGSPTIRIDGVDPFAVEGQTNYGMQCRVYLTLDGLRWMPTKEMVRAAVRKQVEPQSTQTMP